MNRVSETHSNLSEMELQKFLSSIQPFKALSPEDLRQVARKTSEKSFAKEETIYNEGEVADSVWILYKGRVQISKSTSNKPFAIESLGPGEMFGTLCRLGGNGRTYPCTAVASEPTTVLRLLDRTFLEYYTKNPTFIQGVCSLCSQRLQNAQELRCVGQESVPVRVADILTHLSQVHGPTIPFTKREISELVGATLETTFRVLSEFQSKGFVSSSRGKIHIKKPESLRSIVDQI